MSTIVKQSYNELTSSLKQYHQNDFLIIDEVIFTIYPEFQSWGTQQLVVIDHPEGQKNFEGFAKLTNQLLEKGLSRKSKILAVGGGALTDLAGFVAATINRGVAWSVVPTTLLSQIDASLGGKVAINTESGKNLVGAFHEPEKIYLCHEFLSSLSKTEKESGLGELVKYCFLSSEILELTIRKGLNDELIKKCLEYKEYIVKQDPEETKGVRQILNLGHTLGHAYEKNFDLPHGVAVMLGIFKIGQAYFPKVVQNYYPLLMRALQLDELDLKIQKLKVQDKEKFWSFVSKDKKGDGHIIEIIVLDDAGKPKILKTTLTDLKNKVVL